MVEINDVKYLYDGEGKRLLFANDPSKSIPFEKLKNDSRYLDFFVLVGGAKDAFQRFIVDTIQTHAVLGHKPSKVEQKLLNQMAKNSHQTIQLAAKPERSWLRRKFNL